MRYTIFLLMVTLMACDGKLSDEQRRKMREQMELHKIRKVTDLEITEAAYAAGRSTVAPLKEIYSNKLKTDSVAQASKGRVRWIEPSAGNGSALEQELVEAYINSEAGAAPDNIQKIRRNNIETDSILYTFPVITQRDGADELQGVWSVWLSKKELILSMKKK